MRALLEQLNLRTKMMLIAALALAMAAVPTALVLRQAVADWRVANAELAGLPPAKGLLQLMRSTQQHRGLANGVLSGNAAGAAAREQAAQALRFLGVSVVLAKSAARIFYRNAFNIGLPVMIVPEAGQIADGAQLEVDLATGLVRDTTSGREYRGEPVPAFLLEIVADGGLIPNLHKRLHGKPAA